jgi:hypothetical protein
MSQLKDDVLAALSRSGNVAQFVSFSPSLAIRHCVMAAAPSDESLIGVRGALEQLLNASADGSINIRSFQPHNSKSSEFIYGVRTVDDAERAILRLAHGDYFTIANETIDINDGGVSGVAIGGLVEFSPDATPRAVENVGATAALPRELALRLLSTVYGFVPSIGYPSDLRVEFSIHPIRRGHRKEHTIIWELEQTEHAPGGFVGRWPNPFSRFLGDKLYGLLIAEALGAPVPRTTVFNRRVAPFTFGVPTGSAERWIRTTPSVQVPGKFTTSRGWKDPFVLIRNEDPADDSISGVLAQDSVQAVFSGAAVIREDSVGQTDLLIEGVRGFGDRFMSGQAAPEQLPTAVVDQLTRLTGLLTSTLGPVRFEWAFDGNQVWVLQLHSGGVVGVGLTIVPGDYTFVERFDVRNGLEALRELIERMRGTTGAIELDGHVGITSHFGDVLRKAGVPSWIKAP